eukprot:CAMPEP_0172168910 /NCGR_PEP_ID=MMETSP1050-20130122/10409_1 /TAXON_ID=233186 /ORGANISM="Cryptomonas curvata, Strain CCAP979/52" /LENGTH=1108 /DNA_ID=CAMNT_0012839903 /DNA_START=134 /DNA_END=3456 /DNA_ORIENTATION=+
MEISDQCQALRGHQHEVRGKRNRTPKKNLSEEGYERHSAEEDTSERAPGQIILGTLQSRKRKDSRQDTELAFGSPKRTRRIQQADGSSEPQQRRGRGRAAAALEEVAAGTDADFAPARRKRSRPRRRSSMSEDSENSGHTVIDLLKAAAAAATLEQAPGPILGMLPSSKSLDRLQDTGFARTKRSHRRTLNEDLENSDHTQTVSDLLELPTLASPASDSSDEDSEGSAVEGALSSSGSFAFSTTKALEFRQYVSAFFKLKDIKDLIAQFTLSESWPINYNTYLREYITFFFWKSEADPKDPDCSVADSIKEYITTVFSNGKDSNGELLTEQSAVQFKLIATAKNLENFLGNYFVTHRSRNKTCRSSSTEVSSSMVDLVMAAAQYLNSKELTIWRIANPTSADSAGVRNMRNNKIRKTVARKTSKIRAISDQDRIIEIYAAQTMKHNYQNILDFCIIEADAEHLGLGCMKTKGTAEVFRSDNMEKLTMDGQYYGWLGNRFIVGIPEIRVACSYVDNSKTNKTGLSFVTGCCHNICAQRCPVFFTGLYLLDRLLPLERSGQGGSYPELHKSKCLKRMYLFFPPGNPDSTHQISEKANLASIKRLLKRATDLPDDQLVVCKKRHSMRTEGVTFMMDGDVDPERQNNLGNWGKKDRRNSNYAYAALDRTAVLTMGGTAKTERGQHHNPTWNRIQPPDELKTFFLPVSKEWAIVLSDPSHPKWDEDGAKLTGSARSFSEGIRDVYIPTVLQGLSILSKDASYDKSNLWVKYKWLTDNEMYKVFAQQNYEAHLAAQLEDPVNQAALTDVHASCKANERQISLLTNICAAGFAAVQDVHAGFAAVQSQLASLQHCSGGGSGGGAGAAGQTPAGENGGIIASITKQKPELKSEINIQDYQQATLFLPTIQEIDISSDNPGINKGAEQIVNLFEGRRAYLGSPILFWPAAKEVLKRFDGKVQNWFKGVSAKPESMKSSVDLVGRFIKLSQIYKHLEMTCPIQLKHNLLQHAKDADTARGECSLSAWWDRIKTNANCYKQAADILVQLPCLRQNQALTDTQFAKFIKHANSIKINARKGADHCGESHLLLGRQRFAASDELDLLKSEIKEAAGPQALS